MQRGGGAGEREGPHASYQAWSYAAYLEDFNAAVQDGAMALQPCAYLHNHPRDGEIDHPHYREHLERAPLFLERERSISPTSTVPGRDPAQTSTRC